jgi:hypothetical protein
MIRRALAAGAVALALSACGSAAPSASRLRARATAVCQRALIQSSRIGPPAAPAQTASFLRRGIAVLRGELAQLRRLHPPSDQAGDYAHALDAMGRELTMLTATLHAVDRGADAVSAINTLQRTLTPVEARDLAAWGRLDIPACADR